MRVKFGNDKKDVARDFIKDMVNYDVEFIVELKESDWTSEHNIVKGLSSIDLRIGGDAIISKLGRSNVSLKAIISNIHYSPSPLIDRRMKLALSVADTDRYDYYIKTNDIDPTDFFHLNISRKIDGGIKQKISGDGKRKNQRIDNVADFKERIKLMKEGMDVWVAFEANNPLDDNVAPSKDANDYISDGKLVNEDNYTFTIAGKSISIFKVIVDDANPRKYWIYSPFNDFTEAELTDIDFSGGKYFTFGETPWETLIRKVYDSKLELIQLFMGVSNKNLDLLKGKTFFPMDFEANSEKIYRDLSTQGHIDQAKKIDGHLPMIGTKKYIHADFVDWAKPDVKEDEIKEIALEYGEKVDFRATSKEDIIVRTYPFQPKDFKPNGGYALDWKGIVTNFENYDGFQKLYYTQTLEYPYEILNDATGIQVNTELTNVGVGIADKKRLVSLILKKDLGKASGTGDAVFAAKREGYDDVLGDNLDAVKYSDIAHANYITGATRVLFNLGVTDFALDLPKKIFRKNAAGKIGLFNPPAEYHQLSNMEYLTGYYRAENFFKSGFDFGQGFDETGPLDSSWNKPKKEGYHFRKGLDKGVDTNGSYNVAYDAEYNSCSDEKNYWYYAQRFLLGFYEGIGTGIASKIKNKLDNKDKAGYSEALRIHEIGRSLGLDYNRSNATKNKSLRIKKRTAVTEANFFETIEEYEAVNPPYGKSLEHLSVQNHTRDRKKYYEKGMCIPFEYNDLKKYVSRFREVDINILLDGMTSESLLGKLYANIVDKSKNNAAEIFLASDVKYPGSTTPPANRTIQNDSICNELLWFLIMVNAETNRHSEWNFMACMSLLLVKYEILRFGDLTNQLTNAGYLPKTDKAVGIMGQFKSSQPTDMYKLMDDLKWAFDKNGDVAAFKLRITAALPNFQALIRNTLTDWALGFITGSSNKLFGGSASANQKNSAAYIKTELVQINGFAEIAAKLKTVSKALIETHKYKGGPSNNGGDKEFLLTKFNADGDFKERMNRFWELYVALETCKADGNAAVLFTKFQEFRIYFLENNSVHGYLKDNKDYYNRWGNTLILYTIFKYYKECFDMPAMRGGTYSNPPDIPDDISTVKDKILAWAKGKYGMYSILEHIPIHPT